MKDTSSQAAGGAKYERQVDVTVDMDTLCESQHHGGSSCCTSCDPAASMQTPAEDMVTVTFTCGGDEDDDRGISEPTTGGREPWNCYSFTTTATATPTHAGGRGGGGDAYQERGQVRKAALIKRSSSSLQPISEEEVIEMMEHADVREVMSSMPPCDCDACLLRDRDPPTSPAPSLKRVNAFSLKIRGLFE